MFAIAAVSISTKHRASPAHLLAEVIATLGLLLVIFSLARTRRAGSAPAAVGAYIGAAYFFTSSTSFANPAIDVGRMFSNTFAGIAPASVPGLRDRAARRRHRRDRRRSATLYPDVTPAGAAAVILPHPDGRTPAIRTAAPMTNVLFVCLHNAGRSQMSAGPLRAGRRAAATTPARPGPNPPSRSTRSSSK